MTMVVPSAIWRLSITDHCNLRCLYCRPKEQVPHIPHDDILRYERNF
jgi:cyclic pyranopterin phosphate synthase